MVTGRLAHIKSHLDGGFNIDLLAANAVATADNRQISTMRLSSHALAMAMVFWFETNDLRAAKQWFSVAARLDKHWYQMGVETSSPGAKFLQLLKPLVSDDRELIAWFVNYDAPYDSKRIENHKTHDFWAYQAIVALRGDWKRLKSRCDQVLSDSPGASAEKKYLIDHQFYLSLASGDVSGMEFALSKITSPKVVGLRGNDESGFTKDLIFTPAVIFTKIAWMHGYQVKIESPLVPQEWLQINALERYDACYSFLSAE